MDARLPGDEEDQEGGGRTRTHQRTGAAAPVGGSGARKLNRGLIKPPPRHGPINHLMMSYHGDRWVCRRGRTRARKGGERVHAVEAPRPARGQNIDSAAVILGAARMCFEAKHLISPLISNISLFLRNQPGP